MDSRNLKRKIVNTVVDLFLGVVIAICAVAIFVNTNLGHSYIVRDNAQRVSQNLTVKKADKNKKTKTSYDARKTKSISAQELWRARKYPAQPIGRMSVPAVNIHNPLFEGFGAQQQNLSYGVCTVLPNRKLGGQNNYLLAGHYMGSFGPSVLDNMHLMHTGDKVYITDMHKIYEYQSFAKAYNIKPTQVEIENNQGKKRLLTMITCSDFNTQKYGFGQHRTVVQGLLTNVYPATQANLTRYELTNKVVKSAARASAQPKITQAYQSLTLKEIEAGACVIWLIIMTWIIFRTWKN